MSRYQLTDLVEQVLGHPVPERGQNAMVRCPLHEDRRPSLSINLDSGLWICFSCNEKGGLQKLARICNGELDENELAIRAVRSSAVSYYDEPMDFTSQAIDMHVRAMTEKPLAIVEYIVHKGLHRNVLTHFNIGWDGAKIAMPYFDGGHCTAIKYRYPDGHKDAEKGSKRSVYNVDDVRGMPVVIVCEGESDTHAVWSDLQRRHAGDEIAVCGIPGASIARQQAELWAIDLVWSRRIYIAFDADEAGDKGAQLLLDVFGEKAQRARPSRGKDMNDHLQRGGTLEEAGVASTDIRALVA